jgi:ribosomal protein S18 acetylase RimI-like enzyme
VSADSRKPVDLEKLLIRELTPGDSGVITSLRSEDSDLDDFLANDALRRQAENVAQTALAFYDGVLVGYVTIMTDAIVLSPEERTGLELREPSYPVVPALKIARLAVRKEFRLQNRGIGCALVKYAWARAFGVAELVGCRLLTVDAYQSAVDFYEAKLGFERNLDNSHKKKMTKYGTVSMRLDVFGKTVPEWAR